MAKLKLIWDFRGVDAEQTAIHHEIHLKEFVERENLEGTDCGIDAVNEMYAVAYMIVLETDMVKVRDALRPHRGERV